MSDKKTQPYLIAVERSVRQALDLLTRKREYALLCARECLSSAQEEALQHAGCIWIEIQEAREGDATSQDEYCYLVVSLESCVRSRDILPASGTLPDSEFGACLRELANDGSVDMSLPSIKSLNKLCKGAALVADIAAESEEAANELWLRGMLRLGMDPGKWYASDDFSSVKVDLKRIEADHEPEPDEGSESHTEPASVDIADFEVCDRLCGYLEHVAEDGGYGYPCDVFIEYSIRCSSRIVRYCVTEFYSNHSWNRDPANLLAIRFSAEISLGECSRKDVRCAHPAKSTMRKTDGERFLVDSPIMTNDVKTKFHTGRGEDRRPDEAVSADRIMDSPVDFTSWVDMHRKEIELL